MPLTFSQDDIDNNLSRDVISYCLLKNRILNPVFNNEREEKVEEPDVPKAKVKVEELDVPKAKIKVEEQTEKVKVEEPVKSECFEPNYRKIVSIIKTLGTTQLKRDYAQRSLFSTV